MVRQAVDLLGHPFGRQRLESLDQACMQYPPPLKQEAPVGHLVRQGMLEGVLRLGEQARLVQELRGLEVRQATVQGRLRQVDNGPQQGKGHVRANHRSGLKQAFVLWR
jgi:hypothetical protein